MEKEAKQESKMKEELQDIMNRLNELYAAFPEQFQFVLIGICDEEPKSDGEPQITVFEGFHVHYDGKSSRLFTGLYNLNVILMREIERWKVMMIYDSFKVVYSPPATYTEHDKLVPKAQYTARKHRIDRNLHAVMFEIVDSNGEAIWSTTEGFNGAYPSQLFQADIQTMIKNN